ncbi:MAG TPA: amino acid adenylation domain-containing protein, partial [Gemmatimonadales bacterium]|nr:amino acid adenylation domain-containing protein [Gemmatimonadales bacterium]
MAYVIYTSGSTGTPKGVMVDHRNLLNLIDWHLQEFQITPADTASLFASFGFDAAVWELFPYLVHGNTVHLLPFEVRHRPEALDSYFRAHGVSIAFLPTQMAEQFLEISNTSLRLLLTGGDKLKRVPQPGCSYQLVNNYGPTENTVVSSYRIQTADLSRITVGRPIHNVQIYILDEHLNPVPAGVPGELHISGASLGRGYLNQPRLTAEKFIPNPFTSMSGDRMYKTGDLARWLPNGEIDFLGRIDHQVKVRGFRIELGEIEAALQQHTEVKDAAVVMYESEKGQQLVAYYVGWREGAVKEAELRAEVQQQLPLFMVPGVFVELAELPLTPNEKVDRKALISKGVEWRSRQCEYVAPQTEVEKRLCGIWEEVLGVERVGLEDGFFELGGHSLLAVQIVSRVEQQLGVKLGLRELFQVATVRELAEALSGREGESGRGRISAVTRPAELPLSYAQERLWFLAQLGYSEHYHVPQVLRVEGELEVAALRQAVNYLVQRHESLRTAFASTGGKPRQVIAEEVEVGIEQRDLGGLAGAAQEAEVERELEQLIGAPFDLEQAPLWRVVLLRLGEAEHVLGLCLHHIICDAWSLRVLLQELSAAYEAYAEGREPELPAVGVQYADYAVWQRQTLSEEELAADLEYWQQRLQGYEELALPTDRLRPKQMSGRGGRVRLVVAREEADGLREFCRQRRMTLNTLLLASVYVVLSKYSRQEDICLGMAVANRRHWESEGLLGFLVNMVTVRVEGNGKRSVTELLDQVQREVLAAQEREEVPFEKVVEAVQPKRELTRNPIFQVLVNYINVGAGPLRLGRCGLEELEHETTRSKFELSFNFIEREAGELAVYISYAAELYERETIVRLGQHLREVVRQLVSKPEVYIEELELLGEAERAKVLYEWNDTAREYARERLVHELIAEQARKSPERVALVFEGEQLSYGELEVRSGQLAAYLQEQGVGLETPVGVCAERSLELMIAILGILKAGGAYVPLDPEYPEARLGFMLADCGIQVLLTQQSLSERLTRVAEPGTKIIALDHGWEGLAAESCELATDIRPESLAYVIYTSGSTGQPKGVMVTHGGLLNCMQWMAEEYPLGSADRVLQKTPFSFDVSVSELFWPLLQGARLVFAKPGGHREPQYLCRVIAEEGITAMHFVPSMLQVFLEELEPESCSSLRLVLSAGEALPVEVQDRFFERLQAELHNLYGPTEATIFASYWQCAAADGSRSVPIGYPVANTQLYILDAGLKPVPAGIAGELYIAGTGLARGYLGQSQLTAGRFIPNPYAAGAGERMYHTGDLARYRKDGSIEYLGRLDHQVKVRGFRIELEEIEAALLELPGVETGAVIATKVGSSMQLVVYYVPGSPAPATVTLKEGLSRKLPDYMVPALFVAVPALPLTSSGKIDRKKLMAREVSISSEQEYVAPRNEMEAAIAQCWSEILGVRRVGIRDDFFSLGGHSLLAIQLVNKMNLVGCQCSLR